MLLPGGRNRTSKYVEGLKSSPMNVAMNRPPALTLSELNLMSIDWKESEMNSLFRLKNRTALPSNGGVNVCVPAVAVYKVEGVVIAVAGSNHSRLYLPALNSTVKTPLPA